MAGPQTIQFDDDVDRVSRVRSRDPVTSANLEDGIVFSRTVSMGRRSLSRGISMDRYSMSKTLDGDDPEQSGLRRAGDARRKQVFSTFELLTLSYQSIGVIYGDIGTSPLYVFSGIFGSNAPKRDDTIGALSLIIWSLLLMVTLKYTLIILNADNDGEGGTFSCYSLLSRYANITNIDPREEHLREPRRYQDDEIPASNRAVRNTIEKSKIIHGVLQVIGVLAVTMVMSDGVLTPAQSVLGAVQGLNVVVPNISNATVVGTTCGILVALFLVQRFGTAKIGTTFAPIVIIWLGLLASFGIYNLVKYDASVLKAFNPGEAFDYLIRHKTEGWRSLGGVLLAFTGVEALFADLGAFSKRAIQISWLGWCLPCLLLAYTGQAAFIAVKPEAYAYPVFSTVPPGCLILSVVVAVLAAIVASQAIITATFQLLSQIVKLSYFPQVQVIHTSTKHHNQIYVPLVNYLLCIGTVIITAVYRNTTSLGNAYGVCVMFVTFFDTWMTTLVALLVWRLNPIWVVLPFLAFTSLDGAFLSSALTKVPDGAWFTLTLASVLASILVLWRFGKENQWKAEKEDRKPLSKYVRSDDDETYRLLGEGGTHCGEQVSFFEGFTVFFDKAGVYTPTAFSQWLSKTVSAPRVIVFFHMRPLEYPTVPADERFVVSQIKDMPNCYRIICRHGFMDEVVTKDLAGVIYAHVRQYILDRQRSRRAEAIRSPAVSTTTPSTSTGNDEKTQTPDTTTTDTETSDLTLSELQTAYERRVLYVFGNEDMKIKDGTSKWRRFLLSIFLFLRHNSRSKMANLKVPTDRAMAIGFVKDI